MRKMKPKSAKNAAAMDRLAALKRAFRNRRTSSRGCRTLRSHATNAARRPIPTAPPTMIRESVQPRWGASMMAQTTSATPAAERTSPRWSMPPVFGITRGRDEEPAGDDGERCQRQVHEEDRAPREVLEEVAAGHGAERHGDAGAGRPDPDGRCALLAVSEDVDQDRERRREDERRPDAHEGTRPDELGRGGGHGGQRGGQREDHEPQLEGELAPEPVAEVAEGEQQSAEHERVGVDDPLELGRGRVQLRAQGREGDVHDGVVDHDHQEAQAQDGEDQPAPGVDGQVGGGCGREGHRGSYITMFYNSGTLY